MDKSVNLIHYELWLIMKKEELKLAEQYIAPDFKVVEIELTQNILQGSPTPTQQQFGLPTYEDDGTAW